MVSVIAEVLKQPLADIPWMERYGGLVFPAAKPILKQGADGVMVTTGHEIYPVACGVNAENCWENNRFKYFEPDSEKAAIGFFVDNGGAVMKSIQGPMQMRIEYSFDLKFLCWLNTLRLGNDITAGGCLTSGRIVPYFFPIFMGAHSTAGLFAGGIEETNFQAIEVTAVSEITKSPSMFEPFTFAREGVNKNLFVYPYDYFGLRIQGTFIVNKDCLEPLGSGWIAEIDSCVED